MKSVMWILVNLIVSFGCLGACQKKFHDPISLEMYYRLAEQKDGIELKKALNTIINGHTRYSYTPCVWEILEEADQDPENPNHVVLIYTGMSVHKSCRDKVLRRGERFNQKCLDWWSNSNLNKNGEPFLRNNAWNREHVWSKLHGFKKESQHAYTDLHHIVAADSSVNTDRSDNDFANGGAADSECLECREGVGTWEPPASVKGDIARMMFYMATRYEGNDGSGTPDLELVKSTNTPRTTFEDGYGHFGHLCTLLEWHLKDAVSEKERVRNNVIYSWQGNRNPFIDHPEFVLKVWRNIC